MAGNTRAIKIGPVWVTWGSTDLGYTKGGTTISRRVNTSEIIVQDVVVKTIVVRIETTVNVLLAESDYNKLKSVMGLALSRGDDLQATTNTLTLTAVDDPTDVTTITEAFPVGNTEAPFNLERERVWSVQFKSHSIAPNLTFTGAS
jgi:hypothetical protein